MRLLILFAAVAIAAGCAKRGMVKPDLPDATPVAPTIVYVDRVRYVAVPKNLVEEEPIAEGPLSMCPDVAAARKKSMKKLNAHVREIGLIQGTEWRRVEHP